MAFFVGHSLMFTVGALCALVYSESDTPQVMFDQGLIVPAIRVLGPNIRTINDNALYAASLGCANVTRRPRQPIVPGNGLIGTLALLWLHNNFVCWLTFPSSALPTIGAVLIARGRYQAFENAPQERALDRGPGPALWLGRSQSAARHSAGQCDGRDRGGLCRRRLRPAPGRRASGHGLICFTRYKVRVRQPPSHRLRGTVVWRDYSPIRNMALRVACSYRRATCTNGRTKDAYDSHSCIF